MNEEIKLFKTLGRESRIFSLIVDGEPNATDARESGLKECFAPALRFRVNAEGQLTAERVEPIAADARPGRDGKRNAQLKLLAAVLDVDFDVLKQRDQERRQRQLVLVALVLSLLLIVVGSLAIFALNQKMPPWKQEPPLLESFG